MKLAIFDMDGTLIDSQRVIIAAMRAAYRGLGLDAPSDDAVRAIIGLSLPEAFRVLSPAHEDAVLVDAYRSGFAALRQESGGEAEAPLYPGAREALAALGARGVLLSVATGKARRGFDHAVEAHGLHGLFTHPQTADIARSKPHPEMVERAMDLHGVTGAETVMIGDTTFDMEMARAAGARAIGVAWGYHPVAALRAAGAERIVGSFGDLEAAAVGLLEAA